MQDLFDRTREVTGLVPPAIHVSVIAVVAGLASHHTFRKTEPTLSNFLVALTALQLTTGILYTANGIWPEGQFLHGLKQAAIFTLFYLPTLGTSIGLYRAFFHPLRGYPGPLLPRITKWAWFMRYRTGRYHRWVSAMRDKVFNYPLYFSMLPQKTLNTFAHLF